MQENIKMENTGAEVALVYCDSYEPEKVEKAVSKAFELLGGIDRILNEKGKNRDSRLVLKPNLLAKTDPQKACTTHPAVFYGVGKALMEAGFNNLSYGDSPGSPVMKVESVAEGCGIKQEAQRLGIQAGEFETGTEVQYPEGRTADRFIICDEILKADGVINICKMKTHQLERITGAVKNTFGCVFGVNKSASHVKYPTPELFAKMLADLDNYLDVPIHIMDGISAMEGNGPQSGTPTPMNVILVSTDPVALDGLFCHLVYLKPELVPTNAAGKSQGLGTYENIKVVTEEGVITAQEAAAKYGNRSFDVQRSPEFRGALKPVRHIMKLLEKKPAVNADKCVGCGICVKACPVEEKAVKVNGAAKVAEYDYSRCIKCYCCQEMCPEEAITVKKPLLAKIADRKWRI